MNDNDKSILLYAEYNRLDGYSSAVHDYGVWKDGKQTIGCLQKPVKEIKEKLKKLEKRKIEIVKEFYKIEGEE